MEHTFYAPATCTGGRPPGIRDYAPLLFDGSENHCLGDGVLSFRPDGLQRDSLFKKGNRGAPHICVSDFEVLPGACGHEDARQILRMVPNSDRAPGFAPCSEYRMPVANMEKCQSIRLYCPLCCRQEANQEPQLSASSCWQLS